MEDKSLKAANSPQINKEILCPFVGGKLLHRLLLIFHQISGSRSYKIVLIKRKSVNGFIIALYVEKEKLTT